MATCLQAANKDPLWTFHRAVFIRAPAILESGPGVEVLSTYELDADEQQQAKGQKSVAVAVRAGNLMATAFHPELTDDVRWCATLVQNDQSPMVSARLHPWQRLEGAACVEAATHEEASA